MRLGLGLGLDAGGILLKLLEQFPGAVAAYSLYDLSLDTTNIVRVRRSSDNAEANFTAAEVADGTMTDWVNTEYQLFNEDFSSSTGWTLDVSGTIFGGTLNFTSSTSSLAAYKNFGAVPFQTIIVTYTISDYVAGSISYKNFGQVTLGTNRSANGTYIEQITLNNGNINHGFQTSGFTGKIDNFSLQVLTADGHVVTWYDQSGSGNDSTQSTASQQPQIVSSGSLITSNGYNVIQYDGSNDNLGIASLTATGTMLMAGSDGSAFYEVDISGAYDLLADANNTDHPLNETIRVIWNRTLSASEKTAIESIVNYTDWDFSDITSFTSYWRDRSELTQFPLIDTSSGTGFAQAWRNCSSLTSFPLIDTNSGTNFALTWESCSSLTSFPLINTSSGTSFLRAWRNCSSLTSFPLINTSSGTNFSQAWYGCSSLTSFPLIDTSSGTNFGDAWAFCSSLTSFPLINTSSGTNFSLTWINCSSLTSFPLIDTSSATNFSAAWYGCSSLTSFPLINTSSGIEFTQSWRNCSSLTTISANMFDSCPATNFTSAFTNTNLTSQSIENIVVSIDTAGQSNGTLNITGGGNATTATAQTAIDNLRGKGWTVTVPDGY